MKSISERKAGAGLAAATGSVFRSHDGKEFRFNDHVCIEMLMGVPDEKRTGRLVQVRKGCGQFGSCVFMLRLRDGSLAAFENAMMRHASDKRFEDAFYRSNGRQPPVIHEQPTNDDDSETVAYSIAGKWHETGFIVETPSQPQTPGAFSIMVYTPNDEQSGSLHPVARRLAEICERRVRQWEKVASGLNAGDPAKAHAEHMAAVWKRTAEKHKSPNDGTQRPGDAEATNATRATPPGSLE